LQNLRKEEEHVRQEIEQALEKENLDRERDMAGEATEGDGSVIGGVKSGAALMGDLQEIHKKVDRFQSRTDLRDFPGVKVTGEEVTSCYKLVCYILYASISF
jgi:altered-inheritance-of-mitochondria protein 13